MWDTDSPASVVPVDDRVVVGGSFDIETGSGTREFGGVAAVDANTGESVWARPLGNDAGTAPAGRPSVVDDTVYVGTARRTVHALDLSDGTVRWGRSVTDEDTYAVPSVVQAGDTVIIVVGESVVGLNPNDGTTLWHRRFDRPVDRTDSRPTTIADGLLLLPVDGSETEPETLRALDVTTGETRWRVTVPRVEGVPIVADGVIYHSEYDAVAARDLGDGTLRWRHQPRTASALGTPVVDDTGLYVGGATAIYALEEAT
jgi:outer membrane protein assembly factor BamB